MENQRITVVIAERPYRLTVRSEQEEILFRKAAGLLDSKMKEYAGNYAFRDTQDLLAMVSLQFSVECLNLQDASGAYLLLTDRLKEVDNMLKNA